MDTGTEVGGGLDRGGVGGGVGGGRIYCNDTVRGWELWLVWERPCAGT